MMKSAIESGQYTELPEGNMRKSKILVVEDELIIALNIKSILESFNYEVPAIAPSGEEAVEQAFSLHPDLILMDIILSGKIDGIDAAVQIRDRLDIPIIYLTANADKSTVERARITEPYGYINKPIHERDLFTNIDSALYKFGMETRLRESEEKYRTLIESINDIVYAADESGCITFISPRITDLTGYAEHEILGNHFTRFLHKDDIKYVQDILTNTIIDPVEPVEYRILSRSGKAIWVRASNRPCFTNRVFTSVKGTLTDITRRKTAEEATRLNESRLEALVRLNRMKDASMQELTNYVLEEGVRLTKSRLGYLAFLNDEETILTMHSWSRGAMEQCEIQNAPIHYPLEKTGLWGEAVRQRKPVITNEYAASNPLKKGYPEGHAEILRHMNLPIFDGTHIVAVAGVGNKEEEYDDSDIRQLKLLMEGMWRIIQEKKITEEMQLKNEELAATIEELEATNEEFEAQNQILLDAQNEILIRENNLLQIIEGNSIPTFVLGCSHTITHWNKACEILLGQPAAEMIGTNHQWLPFYEEKRPVMADFIIERNFEKLTDYYENSWKKSEIIDGAYESEGFFPKLGKSGRWLFFTAAPIRNERGDITGAIETFQDFTERKHIEEILRNKEQQHRNLIDMMNDGLCVVSKEGVVTYVNSRLAQITGYSAGELLQHPLTDFFDRKNLSIIRKQIEKREKGEPGVYEVEWKIKNRLLRTIVSSSPMYDDGNTYIGSIAVITDITNAMEK